MGLLSKFKRQDDASAAAPATAPDAVVVARTRARRRLIGATVLLGIGIVGFPLLFETQPRPIPVDIPIEIPRKEAAPALSLPAARPASTAVSATDRVRDVASPAQAAAKPGVGASAAVSKTVPPIAPPGPAVMAQAASAQPGASAVVQSRPAASSPLPTKTASVSAAVLAAASTPSRSASSPVKPDTGQRAQALLDGKPAPASPAASETARVIVQVGAYTDADKLREARLKVEKLGMKTYTQVIEADGGRRTRVRVGPFATRAEADKAAARIKAAGLPAAILSL